MDGGPTMLKAIARITIKACHLIGINIGQINNPVNDEVMIFLFASTYSAVFAYHVSFQAYINERCSALVPDIAMKKLKFLVDTSW
jgi:hypothetical protein